MGAAGSIQPTDQDRGHTIMWSVLRELWRFMLARKKLWLLPIVVTLVTLGGLLAAAQGSALAPFIYAIF